MGGERDVLQGVVVVRRPKAAMKLSEIRDGYIQVQPIDDIMHVPNGDRLGMLLAIRDW